mmetsp:Transcript_36831/g.108613  ORF Transcript_36831/g.108613 Transcript_36831/m.108613 type:complete len:261 (+) Transcript_36831:172-954(+)
MHEHTRAQTGHAAAQTTCPAFTPQCAPPSSAHAASGAPAIDTLTQTPPQRPPSAAHVRWLTRRTEYLLTHRTPRQPLYSAARPQVAWCRRRHRRRRRRRPPPPRHPPVRLRRRLHCRCRLPPQRLGPPTAPPRIPLHAAPLLLRPCRHLLQRSPRAPPTPPPRHPCLAQQRRLLRSRLAPCRRRGLRRAAQTLRSTEAPCRRALRRSLACRASKARARRAAGPPRRRRRPQLENRPLVADARARLGAAPRATPAGGSSHP